MARTVWLLAKVMNNINWYPATLRLPNNSTMAITIRDRGRRKQAALTALSFLCHANEIHLGSTTY